MADAGIWIAWGIPTRGREVQALELFRESLEGYGAQLLRDEAIERYDVAVLRPQNMELGGFVLIQGSQEQIDALRRTEDFQQFVTQVQLVADSVGMVDAWVNDGLGDAFNLYEKALRKAGLLTP
ncbi:hypothetical protein AU184_04055 [Mycolicibacterium novocastrense]|uniref:hypothetical protein n=1 Tax=Mycolicibacterium novocastrense TaxID=59813 RepID=UPI00074AE6F7|nr:hypothetical protein [Mycolicibacterium novocastrense]KUH66989.1 hypothetical protein AU183_00005 [Mycolicibacterium novocastrense]KUH71685.1 hypothetical protein AU072_10790 [Mycolicibacterium novocastrense]KUH72094.1 hypothetical protein AU184_04055 [Mycolicibacterium novocastrense]